MAQGYTDFLGSLLGIPQGRGGNSIWDRMKGGTNAAGVSEMSTSLIGDALTRLLSGDLENPLNNSINQAIQTQRSDDIDELRARYNMQGLTYSTPAAYGESEYLARSAPNLLNALGGQQIQALSMILPQLMGLTQMGTPQAQIIQEPSTFQNIVGGITGLAGAAAPFFAPFGLLNKNPLGGGGNSMLPNILTQGLMPQPAAQTQYFAPLR